MILSLLESFSFCEISFWIFYSFLLCSFFSCLSSILKSSCGELGRSGLNSFSILEADPWVSSRTTNTSTIRVILNLIYEKNLRSLLHSTSSMKCYGKLLYCKKKKSHHSFKYSVYFMKRSELTMNIFYSSFSFYLSYWRTNSSYGLLILPYWSPYSDYLNKYV